ncbi:MAG: nucleotidyltransferase [Chitinophagaceae bacterium]|nr:nucleotidyltransferase [Chitinophagaceae bacterium]
MIYSEEQLQRFSNPPAKYHTAQIIRTHEKIRDCIEEGIDKDRIKEKYKLESCKIDIYLQGSYKNSTNISSSSDVDLNVEFTSVYYYDTTNLPEDQRRQRQQDANPSEFTQNIFKALVCSVLIDEFGSTVIKRDNKCIRYIGKENNPDADIIPCFSFKKYTQYTSENNYRAINGIKFKTDDGNWIENYPKIHFDNLTKKSQSTNNGFKPTVRLYKSLREKLEERELLAKDSAKSYYIENLLYNLTDGLFSGSTTDIFKATLNKLANDFNSGAIKAYRCANGVDGLFDANKWYLEDCKNLLIGLTKIRDNNAF